MFVLLLSICSADTFNGIKLSIMIITIVNIILFFFFCVEVFATEKIKEQSIQKQKVFQGIYLSADAYAPVASFFNGGIFGAEASLDVNYGYGSVIWWL